MTDVKWSEWIQHDGGACPVSDDVRCEVFTSGGLTYDFDQTPSSYKSMWSGGKFSLFNIIAYRYQLPKTIDSATHAEWSAASRAARMPVTEEEERMWQEKQAKQANNISDGSTASYYELPPGCTELQDLISYRNLNAQDGEIFRAIYRKGRASHSDELRDARKVLFYAKAEVERLEKLCIG